MRAFTVLLACAVLLAPTALAASFEANVRVSAPNPTGYRANPAIAAGRAAVFVAWQQANGAGGHDVVVSRSTDGAAWPSAAAVDDTPNAAFAQFPDIAARGTTAYVVWRDSRNGFTDEDVFFDRSDGGTAWGADVEVSDETGGPLQLNPSIAVALNGSLYVAYSVGATTETTEIRLVASHDGGATWSPSVAVSGVAPNHRDGARVAVAPNGTVHVIWYDGRAGTYLSTGGLLLEDFEIYIAGSSDGGRSFRSPVIVNTPSAQRRQTSPDLAVDRNGTVYAVWEDERHNTFELFDIFFARSTDGTTFTGEMSVNGTSPVVSAPKRTSHQSPSITWSNETDGLYVAWVDDRGDLAGVGDHNVQSAVSFDRGATWRPFHLGSGGATHYLEGTATYNGRWDPAEATIRSTDDVLDPGSLNATGDVLLNPGLAGVTVDLTGRLRYHDADADLTYTAGEAIVADDPGLLFPQIESTAFRNVTDLVPPDRTLSLLRNPESSATADVAIDIEPGRTMAVTNWSTDTAASVPPLTVFGLASTDPVAASSLSIRYRTAAGYAGTARLNASSMGGAEVMLLSPNDTGGNFANTTADLAALGFDTVDELRFLNVTFVNTGTTNVTFDQLTFNVTRAAIGRFDALDTLLVGTTPPLAAPVLAFNGGDQIAFLDADADGRYDVPEAILLAPIAVSTGMELTARFQVLAPAGAPWRAFLNPFPVNDDDTDEPQYTPDLAVSPSGHLVAVWQDYRNSPSPPWPDIQSARARIFTPMIEADTTPPTLVHVPPETRLQVRTMFNVTAAVNDTSSITRVAVFTQAGSEPFPTEHPMAYDTASGTWYFLYEVPGEAGLLRYWIEAEDAEGNLQREPDAPGTWIVLIENPRAELLGAIILVAMVLLVVLPVVYLLRRGRRRDKGDVVEGPEARKDP